MTSAKRSPWVGISGEVGMIGYEDIGFYGGLNIDMDFSLNSTFAIGGRLGLSLGQHYYGYEYYSYDRYYYYWDEYSAVGFLLGPEIKITFPNNSAIIAGVGGGMVADWGTFYIQAGYKFKRSFYLTAEALLGEGSGFGVGAGFSFGGKRR